MCAFSEPPDDPAPGRGLDAARPDRLLDHFFRHEYGRVVASLTRALGGAELDLAEESVQEAMMRALKAWPLAGTPRDPAAWLHRVARNHAIDALRRSSWATARAAEGAFDAPEVAPRDASGAAEGFFGDDDLGMMFLCSHASLAVSSRVALVLKVVTGFGVGEIARAFFVTESTISQRIVRAKRRLREVGARFEIPSEQAIDERLGSVLEVLYLIFNEGYTPRDGEEVLRGDLVADAIRMTRLLTRHPYGDVPEVHALLALLLLQASRLTARLDAEGALLPLSAQDRGRWDEACIHDGLRHLELAGRGEVLSSFHLLAGIAAVHAVAPSYAATDWRRVLTSYDALLEIQPSPIVVLNRAVALSMVEGPARALEILGDLTARDVLPRYHLLAAARGDCLDRLGRSDESAAAYAEAASWAPSTSERRFLEVRAADLRVRRRQS